MLGNNVKVLLWEIFNDGTTPFQNLRNQQVINAVAKLGQYVSQFATPDPIYDIMKECFQQDPKQRPSFESLLEKLKKDSLSESVVRIIESSMVASDTYDPGPNEEESASYVVSPALQKGLPSGRDLTSSSKAVFPFQESPKSEVESESLKQEPKLQKQEYLSESPDLLANARSPSSSPKSESSRGPSTKEETPILLTTFGTPQLPKKKSGAPKKEPLRNIQYPLNFHPQAIIKALKESKPLKETKKVDQVETKY